MNRETWSPLLALFLAQTFITPVLYIMCMFLALFFHFLIAGLVAFSLYATIWWLVWLGFDRGSDVPQFYPRLIVATIPLVAYTACFLWMHPKPDYSAMIPLLPADIHFEFSTIVTCTLLFPLYSIALQRYAFSKKRTCLRVLGAACAVTCVGALIFTASFQLLPTNW